MGTPMTRRSVVAGLTSLGIGLAGSDLSAQPDSPPGDAAESLKRLQAGNARFVAGTTRHAHESANWRKQLTGGQHPFATIVGCSDSRVPIELVFDQGFGDLFVVRVAGNVFAPDVVGSIEYAAVHLRTALIVVLGHERCGAVTAALQAMESPSRELPGIKDLVKMIAPGLPRQDPSLPFESRVSRAVEANVRWSLKQIADLPEAKPAVADKRITLVGGVYDLQTGRVRFLD